jgi:phosphoglycolate phosphatase (TIGR01487 family)
MMRQMIYTMLASDYDNTLTSLHNQVSQTTINALERWKASGRMFMLVTGRQVNSLQCIFPAINLCDIIVAENGGVIYSPQTNEEQVIGEAPPDILVQTLRERGVDPLKSGKSIIALHTPHASIAHVAIKELNLNWYVMLNKYSSMILPLGINKTTGLRVALDQLGLSTQETVGVGDAENDMDFLAACGYSVAVANALPALKDQVDFVTERESGDGVAELIDRLLLAASNA